MPRVRVKYLNFYYTITRKKDEYIEFDKSFTLGQLLNILSGKYEPKFSEVIFNKEYKLKTNIWIMVDHRVTNDLEAELKDGDVVMFSLPLCGG